ncbi:MAG TPA: FAD-dependent oxidoreductase [Streptosporangiaceae bacterium]|nr:FAD-dependent oxidoreductase [Streptosporangiaceae bacterium]
MADYDVVVVGAGAAGLCAAVTAAEAGASVLVAEASDAAGGASQFSAGLIMAAGTRFQRERGIEDSPEALLHEYLAFNRWSVETAVARRLTEEAGPTVEWLADRGVGVSDIYLSGDDRIPRGHVIDGGGAAIVACLLGAAQADPRVDLAFGRRVDRLLTGEDGIVTGIAAGSDEVTAGAVVLAAGGFGANKELWPRYLPRAVEAEWTFYIGPPTSRGDAFALAGAVGAQIVGHDRGLLNARPNFSQSMDSYYPGWLVFVDRHGQRFVNEMTAYSVVESTIRASGGRVWALLDDAAKRAAVPRSTAAAKKYDMPTGTNWEDWVEPVIDEMTGKGRVLTASTIAALAASMGVEPDVLAGTVTRYNEDVAAGHDTMFEKPARVMRAIAEPPFYATELRLCNLALTGAGPRVNRDGQVLDRGAIPIRGLFAAGECAGGVLGDVYMGSGNALANAVTFGRVAGQNAAKQG